MKARGVFLAAILCLPLRAAPARADLYGDAARTAGVPASLLVAVAGAESGYHPWAINIAGHSYYPNSKDEAARLLESAPDADIGLMQINYGFWGPRLGLTRQQLLDPATNLKAGAEILKGLLEERGTFWRRISGYHSSSGKPRAKWSVAVYRRYLCFLRGEPAASECDAGPVGSH